MIPKVIFIITILLLFYLAATNYNFPFTHAQSKENDKRVSYYDVPRNYPSRYNDPILKEPKVTTYVASQDISDVIYLEKFDKNINIFEEGRAPGPSTNDPNLMIERVFKGINGSTNMAFLGTNDILVLEKVSGKVQRIVNGNMQEKPLIDLNSYEQDGLVGIATAKNQNGSTYVFVYFNEAPIKYGADVDNREEAERVNRTLGFDREGDRLYRYELMGDKLVNPKLLFDLPVPKPNVHLGGQHRGGEVIVGPEGAVYFVVGDLDGAKYKEKTRAQNFRDGTEPDGRAGILRVHQDGTPVGKGILGDTYPLNLYYAYGIRNSFGMDFDPVTGKLWDTENGPDYGDEINLVEPGFNSGAGMLEGPSTDTDKIENLVDFAGKGKYSDPEFSWGKEGVPFTVGPTAIKFLDSDKLGRQYEEDMFVSDFNNGNIYHFDLNEDRTQIILNGALKDKVADKPEELESIIFARGFNGITDLQVGPDGYLYVLSNGEIFRIVPKS